MILGPSILQGGQEYPLKVHQRQPADRLKSVSTGSRRSSLHPRCKSGDGIISPVVMIIAQHRGVSRRIAPSRPENWLFCIIMTSPSSSPHRLSPFCTRHRFSDRERSPPRPSRLEISLGFSARFFWKNCNYRLDSVRCSWLNSSLGGGGRGCS